MTLKGWLYAAASHRLLVPTFAPRNKQGGPVKMRSPWSVTALAILSSVATGQRAEKRPMDFLDVQLLRSAGALAVSPDGRSVLYALTVPDWKEARSTTDIWLVSAERGVASARQLT